MTQIKISLEVKQRICKAVQENNIIWDKTKKLHSNRNALKRAWERVAEDVGVSEEICRTGWKNARDSKRYHKKKAMKSGSKCDIEFDSSDDSCEPWELQDDLHFLEEPSSMRTTDSTPILSSQNDDVASTNSSSYTYKDMPSSSAKARCLSGLAESGVQLAENMRQIVEMAGKEKSAHAGFLSHLSAIMDDMPKKQLIEFQGSVMELAYGLLSRQND